MKQTGSADPSRREFLHVAGTTVVGSVLGIELMMVEDLGAADTNDGQLRVGAAAVELVADDSMVVAGGIAPRYVQGQEGQLRATAIVLQKSTSITLAIVACDLLMMTRDQLDPVAAEIERECGIPAANLLINCTHTHHAPSTCRIHGYDREKEFCRRVQRAIVQAVRDAKSKLADVSFHYQLGQEKTVGKNSRLLLRDGSIYWIGARDDVVRPTGPFDPDLPVLGFRETTGKWKAVIFNHSTHTIGALQGNPRSPAFYGLAAQELESELSGIACFLAGASGSTHRLDVSPADAKARIKQAVVDALAQSKPQPVNRLASLKKPFQFKVRKFDEAAEERAVMTYCEKYAGSAAAEAIGKVFRQMRSELAPHQGERRTTWLQTMLIGDTAIVGVPAELFTKLGLEIKQRSPFPQTCVAELANDWIGYVGDRDAYELGGYQLWMGLHSYCEPDTGARMVDQVVSMLEEMRTSV